jgi:hypothetical protein
MKALLLGSTIWHTQYPQKNEPKVSWMFGEWW